tara:strand:- start:166 stop:1098 length:933 start_codon:yes stop_codon:yes gene_type:complete
MHYYRCKSNDKDCTLINDDVLNALSSIKSKSIDVIITDPPYYKVANEKWDKQWVTIEEYIKWCAQWIKESKRVLKLSGRIFVFGYSYQLAKMLPKFEDNGFAFRQNIILWKGLQSAAGRTSNKLRMFPTTTEYISYYNVDNKNYIRELLHQKKEDTNMSASQMNEYLEKSSNGGGTWSTIAGLKQQTLTEPTKDDWEKLDKLFGGLPRYEDMVYTFNVQPRLTDVIGPDDINFYDKEYRKKKFHPTQKPLSILDILVEASSNEGNIILDLFMGSGSTGISSLGKKRSFIGIENNSFYYKRSKQWILSTFH